MPADSAACVIYLEQVFPRPRFVDQDSPPLRPTSPITMAILSSSSLASTTVACFSLINSHNQSTHVLTQLSQAISRRVPTFSRPDVLSATPLRRTAATRSDLLCTVSGAARPAPLRATPTPMPTSRRALSGTTTLSSSTSRTPRSTSPVPRWLSVA
jgi:hypothetical protein